MAERSILFSTTGTGDGTGTGYTSNDLFELFRALFAGASGANLSGVAPDYLNKLAVAGSSSPLAVNTGAALVYGVPYFNSASVSVAIPTPTTATRIDRIVLRASWSAQTVRVTRIPGSEGAGAPSLTQSGGVTWDMPLAQVAITTGGVITITDQREYLQGLGDGGVGTAKIADGAVTTAKLADNSVTSAKLVDATIVAGDLASNAVTTAKIADANVTTAKIADGNVTANKLATPSVYTSQIGDEMVTNAKLANMAYTTVKGRITASAGDPEDLTPAQLVAIVTLADGAGSGLDADMLDGLGGAGYSLAAHTHNASTIDADSVTNSKLANMADATVKGRNAGAGTGDPVDLDASALVAIVRIADGTGSGLDADTVDGYHYPDLAPIGHTHNTGTLLDGSITTAKIALLNVNTGTLAPNAVTNAKMAQMADATVKGRTAGAGTGDPVDLNAAALGDVLNTITTATITSFNTGAGMTGGGTPRVKRVGGTIHIYGYVDYTGATTTLHILACTLPVGYRPANTQRCVVVDEITPAIKAAYVDTSGQLYIKAPVLNARYYIDITIGS